MTTVVIVRTYVNSMLALKLYVIHRVLVVRKRVLFRRQHIRFCFGNNTFHCTVVEAFICSFTLFGGFSGEKEVDTVRISRKLLPRGTRSWLYEVFLMWG